MASAQITYGKPKVVVELEIEEAAALEALLTRIDATSGTPEDGLVAALIPLQQTLDQARSDDKGNRRCWPTEFDGFRNGEYILLDRCDIND